MNIKNFLSRLPLCILTLMLIRSPLLGATAVLTDLGLGSAKDINNSGVILLNSSNHVYRVVNGVRQELPFPLGATGNAINDAGHITGMFLTNGYPVPFLDRNGALSSYLYRSVIGFGLNAQDVIVGDYVDNTDRYTKYLATVLTFDSPTVLDIPQPQNFGSFRAINDSGVAVGMMAETKYLGVSMGEPYRYVAYRARAVKYSNGQITYLDPRAPIAAEIPAYFNTDPSVRLSEANSINASGVVVGEAAVIPDGPKHAFRHAGVSAEDLGTLGGATSTALDVNDAGTIVGAAATNDGVIHAAIWENGKARDLNADFPPGSSLVLVRANAINNYGQIVGDALVDGATHAFLYSSVSAGVAPRITVQPTGATVAPDEAFTFNVEVTGSLPLHYQWQKGTNLLEGQTSPSLSISNLNAFARGDYRVVVTNAFGRAVSEAATLVVLDPRLTALNFAGVQLEGGIGVTYRIEATPKLSPESWKALETVTLTNAVQLWIDFDSIHHAARLYRAVRLPSPR